MYLACDGDDIFGSTYGIRDSESSDMARIGGMWVAPLHRRQGVGRALLEAVRSWAHEHGFKRMGLWAPSEIPQRSRSINKQVSDKPDVAVHCQRMPCWKSLNWSCLTLVRADAKKREWLACSDFEMRAVSPAPLNKTLGGFSADAR